MGMRVIEKGALQYDIYRIFLPPLFVKEVPLEEPLARRYVVLARE
jgi:hypothetical protein